MKIMRKNILQNMETKPIGGKAKKVAQDFESFFVNQILNEMSKNINPDGSTGNKIFKSMYYEEISKQIAKKSDFGIKNLIYNRIKKSDSSNFDDITDQLKTNSMDKFSVKNVQSYRENSNFPINEEIISHKIKNSNLGIDNRKYIEKVVEEASKKYGVNQSTIMAIIETESNFNSRAKSQVGAKGLMQLMDPTAKELGVKNVWSIKENIMAGTKYFARLENTLGDKKLALAAYNAGMGNVKKYKGIPPFKETKTYIGKVLAKEKSYNKDVKYE